MTRAPFHVLPYWNVAIPARKLVVSALESPSMGNAEKSAVRLTSVTTLAKTCAAESASHARSPVRLDALIRIAANSVVKNALNALNRVRLVANTQLAQSSALKYAIANHARSHANYP